MINSRELLALADAAAADGELAALYDYCEEHGLDREVADRLVRGSVRHVVEISGGDLDIEAIKRSIRGIPTGPREVTIGCNVTLTPFLEFGTRQPLGIDIHRGDNP